MAESRRRVAVADAWKWCFTMKSFKSPLHPGRFDDWASIGREIIVLRAWSEFVWENMNWVVAAVPVKISGE